MAETAGEATGGRGRGGHVELLLVVGRHHHGVAVSARLMHGEALGEQQ